MGDDMKIDWNAVAKLGIPGVIAMFLVYRLALGFEVFNTRLTALESQHVAMASSAESAKDLAGRALMTNERVLWVLQVMCVQDAKTTDQRRECMKDSR